MKKAFQTSRKSRRATALSFPSSPTEIVSRAKPRPTSSSFRPPGTVVALAGNHSSAIARLSIAVRRGCDVDQPRIWLNPSPWSSWPRSATLGICFPLSARGSAWSCFHSAALFPRQPNPEPTATSPVREITSTEEKTLTEPKSSPSRPDSGRADWPE